MDVAKWFDCPHYTQISGGRCTKQLQDIGDSIDYWLKTGFMCRDKPVKCCGWKKNCEIEAGK